MPSTETIEEKFPEPPSISESTLSDTKDSRKAEVETNDIIEKLPRDPVPELNNVEGKSQREACEEAKPEGEFPDGGLRAWLVVFGVRLIQVVLYALLIGVF